MNGSVVFLDLFECQILAAMRRDRHDVRCAIG